MLCHKCNAEIADYSKFCSFCGEPIRNDEKKTAITEVSEIETNEAVKENTDQKNISVNTNELHAMPSKKVTRNNKKFYLLLILLAVIGSAVLLLQNICFHDWIPATCSTVETCSKCGETKDSELLPHTWIEATCTEPSRCSQCGKVQGEAKSHSINNMGVCATCGKAMGKDLTLANFEEYLSFRLSYSDIVSTVRRRIAYDKNGVIFHPTEIRIDGVNIST
ncbi:MAG: zinc-ribbon domain-containing protein, partial [Acetivibrio ethanolgignens]